MTSFFYGALILSGTALALGTFVLALYAVIRANLFHPNISTKEINIVLLSSWGAGVIAVIGKTIDPQTNVIGLLGAVIYGLAYIYFFKAWHQRAFSVQAQPETVELPKQLKDTERAVIEQSIDDPEFRNVALDTLNKIDKPAASTLIEAYKLYKQWLPKPSDGLFEIQGLSASPAQIKAVARTADFIQERLGVEWKSEPYDPFKEYVERVAYDDRRILNTPFVNLLWSLKQKANIPQEARFEGTFILGAQGSGKTRLMQYLAHNELQDGNTVVVIDSQSQIIPQLAQVRDYGEKTVLIEPGTVALNPFDIKGELGVDLITFLLRALGGEGSQMTSRQSSYFRPIVRLLLSMPDATFIDMYKIVSKTNGIEPYRQYIQNLPEHLQTFFSGEQYTSKSSTDARNELEWRLRPIIEDPVYTQMFCSPQTTIDLGELFQEGKLILIDTNKHQLGGVRSALFGRLFIAFIYRAAMQRQADTGHPVYLYVDEAAEYLEDDQLAHMIDELRKRRVAITLATQRLDKVESTNMRSALLGTSVKFARPGNDGDAHTLAREMNQEAQNLLHLPKRVFALYIRDVGYAPPFVTVPHFDTKDFPQVSLAAVRERMKVYAPKPQNPRPTPEPDDDDDINPGAW